MNPISEKYIKSRLKVYFPIFSFKISILIAHLNKLLFRKGDELAVLVRGGAVLKHRLSCSPITTHWDN